MSTPMVSPEAATFAILVITHVLVAIAGFACGYTQGWQERNAAG